MDGFVKEDHVKAYSKFRPTYPPEVYTKILDYLGEKLHPPYKQAVDVGCGSGQCTRPLAPYFNQVLGIDASQTQITEAKRANDLQNVDYRVGNCFDFSIDSNMTELIISATAAHWFDPIEDFYKEVDKKLKAKGVLAVYSYGVPKVHVNGTYCEKLSDEILKFRNDKVVEGKRPGNLIVDGLYQDLHLPYPGWKKYDDIEIVKPGTLEDVVGYCYSWSPYWEYRKLYPDKDPLIELVQSFQDIIGPEDTIESYQCSMVWPVAMLLGRKPDSTDH